MTSSPSMDWKAIVDAKQAKLASLLKWKLEAPPSDDVLDVTHIPASCGILDELELKITDSPADTILKQLASGSWSAESVAIAFCKRAAIAQQLVNCLTEVCFDEAIARGKELDSILKTTGKTVGPLHGLPVSIKDCFKIKGLDSTVGFVCYVDKPLEDDSVLISILRGAGAIMYCKTNVPTAMMIAETYNNVFGRTLNPYNRSLSSGGSSGGEAALLALKGSPLGVGTDIGGSIRIPGAFCGVYSLRPSFGRFPTWNTRSGMPGQEAINSVNGPLSRSLSALVSYSEAVINGGQPWLHDPKMVAIPWRAVELPQKLSFGLIKYDGVVRPHPPVDRALDVVVEALKKAGHEVVEFEPYEHEKGAWLLAKCFHADGGISIRTAIEASSEDWPLGLQDYQSGTVFHPSTYDMWQLQLQRSEYMKAYLDHWTASKATTSTGRPVDFVLSPVTPYAACKHDTYEYVGYTGVWNVVDYAAATIPILRSSPDLDVRTPSYDAYVPKSEQDRRIWSSYKPEDFVGAPVSVQVVGRRMQEEAVLEACKVVEAALKDAGKEGLGGEMRD